MVPVDKEKLDGDMIRLTVDAIGAIINGQPERAEYYTSVLGWLKMLAEIIKQEEQND